MDDSENTNLSETMDSECQSTCIVSEVLNCKEEDDDSDDDCGEYYFESDHVALRNNSDYRKLLKAIVVLQAQRTQALQDIDKLHEAKEAALADPIAFVEKLQRGEDLNLPKQQKIYKLPDIDWNKYVVNGSTPSFTHKHMTRHKKPAATVSSPVLLTEGNDSNSGSSSNEFKVESDESASAVIRGRIRTMSKSQTFNQPWSPEEQKRLDDLLVKYPPEEVEARRWEKIAKELGNRIPQQVASRVQKYFKKLAKIGLPVPGRAPRVANYGRRLGVHRHQRHNRFLFQSSTFFATREPPVFMSDYDDDNTNNSASTSASIDQRRTLNEDDDKIYDSIPLRLRDTPEYQELMQLEQLKKSQLKNITLQQSSKCANCGCDPILGRRWRCMDCPPHSSPHLCDECSDCDFGTLTHVSGHRLEPVGESLNSFVDSDYIQFAQGKYSYLDTNYMPAT